MDPRIQKLIDAFQANGWTFVGSADVVSDWWFSDMLMLVSNWRPVGKNLYLVLLTDPQILDEKIVWCVTVTTEIPVNERITGIGTLTLNDIKRTDLRAFVQTINKAVLTQPL